MRAATPEQQADYERDIREAAPRPTDPMSAHQIAALVRSLDNIQDAASLIESYASCAAAAARLDATREVYERVEKVLARAQA